ncbi:MAG: PAS domain-containing protein [Bacteroidia bacterium]|nr:PAS domain-containing protein [Bacteroidia bacterium]
MEQVDVGVWQDLFTSIIEDADSNVLLIDEEFKVITLNPGFYWIFSETYGIELHKGSSILGAMERVNPVLAHEWKERFVLAMSGTPIKVEDVFDLDGRRHFWETHFKSISRPDGTQVISVFSRDITVRKAYQKKLLENEANVRSILNTIEDSIWLVNNRFELIDFNREFYRSYKIAFGVKPARGKNILDLIPSGHPHLRDMWKARYQNGILGKPGKYFDNYTVGEDLRTYEVKTIPS